MIARIDKNYKYLCLVLTYSDRQAGSYNNNCGCMF